MKLKELRQQPLLTVPPMDSSLLRLTDTDIRLMQDSLAEERETSKPENYVSSLHFLLSELGLPQDVTNSDRELMRKDLDFYRRAREGFEIAEKHHRMHKIGYGESITNDDLRMMRETLERWRKGRPGEGMIPGATARIAADMKLLGFDPSLTDVELDLIRKELENSRKKGERESTVYMLHHMKCLGLEVNATPDDIESMRYVLAYHRRKKQGGMIGQTHWMMRTILGHKPDEQAEMIPTPPLKVFKK